MTDSCQRGLLFAPRKRTKSAEHVHLDRLFDSLSSPSDSGRVQEGGKGGDYKYVSVFASTCRNSTGMHRGFCCCYGALIVDIKLE